MTPTPSPRPARIDLLALSYAQSRREKKLRQQEKPRGGLTEAHPGWGGQHAYLRRLLESSVPAPHGGHLRFLVHLLASSPKGAFVPVSYKLLRPLDPSADPSPRNVWAPLVEAGLVERREAERFRLRSAEYRLSETVRAGLAAAAPATVASAEGDGAVDLVTGRRTTAVAKSALYDGSRNAYPPLVRDALRAIARGLFFAPAVEAHLEDLAAVEAEARRAMGAAPGAEALARGASRAAMRLLNDRYAYAAVLRQRSAPAGAPGVYEYRAAYAVGSTGRIVQVGGGLQSASRRMKAAAYAGVPGARNYDLQACHVNVLVGLLEDAGIDPGWFVAFADRPGERARLAEAVGLPEGALKAAVYALVNGAGLPARPDLRWGDRPEGEVVALARDAVPAADFDGTWRRLREALGPALGPLRAWHRHLLGPYAAAHGGQGRGGGFVLNRAGMRFYPHRYGPGERGRKLAAFVLQGYESALVHTLTALGAEYGYAPIANEHDGLVTLGEVPEAAVEEAKRAVGLARGRLVLKDLCGPDDRASLEACCRDRGVELP